VAIMQLDWLSIIGEVAELVLVPLISAAVLYFVSWLKVKKQELLEKIKDDTTKKYLEMLDKTVAECVLATNQTYVNTLKQEGKFDEEAQKKAFQLSYDTVNAVLADEVKQYLTTAVKDLQAYITTKIEAQVGLNHK
jgi:hypothetical protein